MLYVQKADYILDLLLLQTQQQTAHLSHTVSPVVATVLILSHSPFLLCIISHSTLAPPLNFNFHLFFLI